MHSICTRCFRTVALDSGEVDLDNAEQNHVCDPWLVAHWKELAAKAVRPPAQLAASKGTVLAISFSGGDFTGSLRKSLAVFLRGAEALHLGTVAEAGFRIVYSSDAHLLAAARHFGNEGRNVI